MTKNYDRNIFSIMVANCPWLGDVHVHGCDNDLDCEESNHEHTDMDETIYDNSDDLENMCPKYLIFSTGSKTYVPHQIG